MEGGMKKRLAAKSAENAKKGKNSNSAPKGRYIRNRSRGRAWRRWIWGGELAEMGDSGHGAGGLTVRRA